MIKVDYPQKQIDRQCPFCLPSWLIVGRTKLVFELELEFDEKNRCMKFGTNPIKMTKLWLSFFRQNPY